MRSIIKTIISGSFLSLIITKWDFFVGFFEVQNVFQDDVDLLIKLASMIGYTLFIAFAFFVQQAQIRDIMHANRSKGVTIYISFVVVTILFLTYMAMNFTLQIALVNLMLYLIIVSIFDYVGERMMITLKAHKSHPKSII